MKNKYLNGFLYCAGMVLCLTALAKLLSAGGSARVLEMADPLLMMKTRQLLILVGVAELALAAFLFFGRNNWFKLSLTAWMATNFLVYRAGLWWTGAEKPCGCLGTITDALALSPRMVDWGMKGILAYLLIGSYNFLFIHWRQARKYMALQPALPTQEPAV